MHGKGRGEYLATVHEAVVGCGDSLDTTYPIITSMIVSVSVEDSVGGGGGGGSSSSVEQCSVVAAHLSSTAPCDAIRVEIYNCWEMLMHLRSKKHYIYVQLC